MGAYDAEVSVVDIEIVNADQAAAWDGHEGDVWTEHADRYEATGRTTVARLFDAGLITTADRVVDIGCGTGGATRTAARIAVEGEVLGIDLSTRMLELARQRSAEAGLDNVSFVRGDAQVFPFEAGSFDVAISVFGSMFFSDPVAAFSNIAGALREDGRIGLLAWRNLDENEWLVALRSALAVGRDLPSPPPDAPTPFSLGDPARARAKLDAAGFSDIALEPIDEPMYLGADADDATTFVSTMGIVEGLTQGLDATMRTKAMANLADLLASRETPDGVVLGAATWLITAVKR